jgi:hypothetical protein
MLAQVVEHVMKYVQVNVLENLKAVKSTYLRKIEMTAWVVELVKLNVQKRL